MYGMDTNCRAGGSKNRTVKDPSRNQCLVCLRTLLVRIRVTMATTATKAIATTAIATTVTATKMAMGWKWTASACHVSDSCVVDGWCMLVRYWKLLEGWTLPCRPHSWEFFAFLQLFGGYLQLPTSYLLIIYAVSTILIKQFCINLSAQKRYKIWPPTSFNVESIGNSLPRHPWGRSRGRTQDNRGTTGEQPGNNRGFQWHPLASYCSAISIGLQWVSLSVQPDTFGRWSAQDATLGSNIQGGAAAVELGRCKVSVFAFIPPKKLRLDHLTAP